MLPQINVFIVQHARLNCTINKVQCFPYSTQWRQTRTHTPNGSQRAFVCCVNWNCLFLRRISVENHQLEAAQ